MRLTHQPAQRHVHALVCCTMYVATYIVSLSGGPLMNASMRHAMGLLHVF